MSQLAFGDLTLERLEQLLDEHGRVHLYKLGDGKYSATAPTGRPEHPWVASDEATLSAAIQQLPSVVAYWEPQP